MSILRVGGREGPGVTRTLPLRGDPGRRRLESRGRGKYGRQGLEVGTLTESLEHEKQEDGWCPGNVHVKGLGLYGTSGDERVRGVLG